MYEGMEADIAALLASGEFDENWYVETYPDVKILGMRPVEHYLWIGKRLGRSGKAFVEGLPHASNDPAPLSLPSNVRNYWLPQALRDYLIDTDRETAIPLVTSLMDLVTAYGERDGLVEQSEEFPHLLHWMRRRAHAQNVGAPTVSIIVPTHNRLVFSLCAVASILANSTRFTYEIVVADDCSSDGTSLAFASSGGAVKHIRNTKNLGFLQNCNAAAERARGAYIVLLNNDTITLPGWLDELLALFERQDVGLVGSKLLNSDGTLQEAGGIFWSDGSAWNLGRNQSPLAPEFNYVKEVDYCSGASLAMRASDWRRLDGFDRMFSPAYCEDADLAFRVREAGLKVFYSPHSDLVHHEGVSHGRDVSTGVKSYQITNSVKMRQRWSAKLTAEHFPNGEQVFVARDRSRSKRHVLIVDHYIPQADKDAGSRSILSCIRFFLDEGYQVTFWPDNLHWDKPYAKTLQTLGVEVVHGAQDFEKWWEQNGRYFELAFLSRAHVALKYIDPIRKFTPRTSVAYYGHDLPWRRMMLEYETTGNVKVKADAEAAKEREDAISARADFIIYPAAEECEYARAQFKGAKAVIEMPVLMYDEQHLANAEANIANIEKAATEECLFVGGFAHPPNEDGIKWFLAEVLPRIRQSRPNCRLSIVGSKMPDWLLNATIDGVDAKGWLSDDDLEKLMGQAACTIAPLRFGAGVKGKVINAFGLGSPVVSTSIGLQGIPDIQDLAFVGDSASEFSEAVLQCLNDRQLAAEKARSALRFVRDRYSRTAMARALRPLSGVAR